MRGLGSECAHQGVWNKNNTLVPSALHSNVMQVLVSPQFSHKFDRVATISMTKGQRLSSADCNEAVHMALERTSKKP